MTGREWANEHVEQAKEYAEKHVDRALWLINRKPEVARETLSKLIVAALTDGAAAGYEGGYWEGMCDS